MRPGLTENRCPRCHIRKALCFCEHIPQISLETRVIILMHTVELPLTSNTAKLANNALSNSSIIVHGRKHELLPPDCLREPGRTSLVLYPSPFATELSAKFISTLVDPVSLIVPDASWRQTTKFVRREPALVGIPHIKLPAGPPSEYHLRVQRHESGLCTLEAIARAIGLLESRDAQYQLERVLRIMVERTLWSKGKLGADQCHVAGIPREAFS